MLLHSQQHSSKDTVSKRQYCKKKLLEWLMCAHVQ